MIALVGAMPPAFVVYPSKYRIFRASNEESVIIIEVAVTAGIIGSIIAE